MKEGRDKVGGLRFATGAGADLGSALDEHGRQLAAQHPARFTLTTSGTARTLHPPVHEELLAVGREAIRNAFLQARPAAVR
ncbi:hypothetical protein [Pseudoduganella albidiflava]|uniref:Uncharacterized protein n=1 Tax=Pseudoduganella albidiflava TaxID=321983 RepID=A0A411X0A4_9BURK|nr:hypothetical protein [Pseudoduganella albidiflava]QBI02417.1 hypothetical protein EYF70_17375 [Pseudoduganella albidiflava]GGY43012.1 hypothetical protein GCM10007387_26300 [Pseudoduganella albidiflava]